MGPYGSQTSKRYSSLKSLLNLLKLFLNFLPNGYHRRTVLDFWNFEFMIFHISFFVFVSMARCGRKKIKTLLLAQITFRFFPNFSWISSLWSAQKNCFGIMLKFGIYDLKQFFFRKFKVHDCTLWINWKVIGNLTYRVKWHHSHLTLGDLEDQSQVTRISKSYILVKEQS